MKLKITKFEQAAHIIEVGGQKLAVDFGCETAPETVTEIGPVAAAVVSHQHIDHFDLAHLRRFGAPVYGPPEVVEQVVAQGLPGVALREAQQERIGQLWITATAIDHGPKATKPVQNYGFTYRAGGATGFFAGDMGSSKYTPEGRFDFVMMPVGGGFVFSVEEALEMIRALDHRGVVIPIHYHGPVRDMEAGARLGSLAQGFCDVRVLEVGESMEF